MKLGAVCLGGVESSLKKGRMIPRLVSGGERKVRMSMNNGILGIVIALLWMTILTRIFMNVVHRFGPDFVGFFEDLWRKAEMIKGKN
ncbi:hypothetical protein [Desulfosporosinus shakirovi]|uniref:hypothetical protein n=1 Tax=Desulfosporosinus shakirovi TaxID=2885154 RepID=UPI0037BE2714